jgi:hypothetical protein
MIVEAGYMITLKPPPHSLACCARAITGEFTTRFVRRI